MSVGAHHRPVIGACPPGHLHGAFGPPGLPAASWPWKTSEGLFPRAATCSPDTRRPTGSARGAGRKSTRLGANGVVELSPFDFLDRLADLVPPPRNHRHRRHSMPRCGRPAKRAVSRRARANEKNPASSVDRKLFSTSTIGSHSARSAPAVAPHDPPRSAVACRSAIGRPIN